MTQDEEREVLMRQRQMAALLQQQGQAPQGQMVSGRYVQPSWTQYLASGLANYRGQQMSAEADKKQKAMAEALQAKKDAWLKSAPIDQPAQTMDAGSIDPSMADVGPIETAPAKTSSPQDVLNWGVQGAQIDPQMAQLGMALLQSQRKDDSPISVKEGETLLNRKTMKPIYSSQKKEQLPNDVREYEYARAQGYQGTFEQFQLAGKRAGASNVNVKTDVKTGESLAKEIGPMMKDSVSQAEAAVKQVDAAQRVIKAVDSNQMFAGPGANVKLKGTQVLDALGIAGKDDAERLANTRQAIRGLAELTLQGRQQMRGQGAITESEGKLAEKAMSGEISELTAAELKQLARASERAARFNYAQHDRRMKTVRDRPEFQGVAPFYEAPQMPGEMAPPPATPAAPANGWSIRPL